MLKGFTRAKSTAFLKSFDKGSTTLANNTFKNEIVQKSINQ
jgi:hypothetical protein